MKTDEERLWTTLGAVPLDFETWVELITVTENAAWDDIGKIEKVYDPFLRLFPLCHEYLKSYAEHKARLRTIDEAVKVYEQAVEWLSYSVSFWFHYCTFGITTSSGDRDTVRTLFERGLAKVGTDYLSSPLWDLYIDYETGQQEWGCVAMIFSRILKNPNKDLDLYFGRFKHFIEHQPLSEEPVAAKCKSEELKKYFAIREEMYKKAKEFDSKIIGYERSILTTYFHVRALSNAERGNWNKYLDFIEREGDFEKVVQLYERCLISCALYSEYWLRYVRLMEKHGNLNIAYGALARAEFFVKDSQRFHEFAVQFKGRNGDIPILYSKYNMGANPSAQGPCSAGYGVQPQSTQGQQWTHGYTQLPYNAYGGYGSSCANPQMPATMPQTDGYVVQPQAIQGQQWTPGYTQHPYNAYGGYGSGCANPQMPATMPQTAGYVVQPQAIQGQQWTPGYTQHPYNAYGGYRSGYTNMQMPAMTPQTAAYFACPSTDPAQQVLPPQSYGQLTAAAPTATAQAPQPALVPQAYHGTMVPPRLPPST